MGKTVKKLAIDFFSVPSKTSPLLEIGPLLLAVHDEATPQPVGARHANVAMPPMCARILFLELERIRLLLPGPECARGEAMGSIGLWASSHRETMPVDRHFAVGVDIVDFVHHRGVTLPFRMRNVAR